MAGPDQGGIKGPGFIYIVKEAQLNARSPEFGTGLYKIGLTNENGDTIKDSIRDRITNLQTGNPRLLYFRYCRVPHMLDYESYAHTRANNEENVDAINLPFGKDSGKTEWFFLRGMTEDAFVLAIQQAIQQPGAPYQRFSPAWTECRIPVHQ